MRRDGAQPIAVERHCHEGMSSGREDLGWLKFDSPTAKRNRRIFNALGDVVSSVISCSRKSWATVAAQIIRKRLMRFIDREEVARRLTYDVCIPIVRQAMIAFSKGETKQLLRSIIPLSDGRLFGVMPGAMGTHAPFGAKLISVFHENFTRGMQSHQGLVILFNPETGAPVCAVHGGEVTAIRTAAASAVATDALARKDARRLALLGYGEH